MRVTSARSGPTDAFPRHLEIETVDACNELMKPELFEKIAEEIGQHADEVTRVHLYRDGEPLLDKRLSAKVHALKSRGVQRVGISTNAALLDEDRAERLLAAGLDEIILSVDSLRPSVYEAIRVNLKFSEVMANCLRFIELRNQIQSDCQVWVRMIRQESNRDEWPQFEGFWKLHLQPTDRVDYRNLHNWGSQLINFRPVVQADTAKPCIAPFSLMVIFADGSVPRCNVDYNNKHPIGNVRDSSIAELWQSKIQQDVRAAHLSGRREGICNGCTVWAEEANQMKVAA